MPELLGLGSVIDHNGHTYVIVDWREDGEGEAYWICENNFGRQIRLRDVQLYDESDICDAQELQFA